MARSFTGIEVIRRENVKKLMKINSMSRNDLSEGADINYALLGHYIGKNPSKAIGDEIASRIEQYFDKPSHWLDHEHDSNQLELGMIVGSNAVRSESEPQGMIDIPIYSTYFCCGNGNGECDFEEIKGKRSFPPSFFTDRGIKPDDFKLICASNDSLKPYINDKDEVGIVITDTEVADGSVYAILLDGDRMLKQIFREAGGSLRLHSFNDEYPDRLVTADNHDSLIIVGKQVYRAG